MTTLLPTINQRRSSIKSLLFFLCSFFYSGVGILQAQITINELDVDQTSIDTGEFIELYGPANASLDGLVLVFFDGNDDLSYLVVDLDGQSLDENGFFVLGTSTVPNVDMTFSEADNNIQNGADAVALITGDTTDFPENTAIPTSNVIDAIVYSTGDLTDTGLLTAFGESTQYDEDENGMKDTQSIGRNPDGSEMFVVQEPTPGTSNANVSETRPPIDIIFDDRFATDPFDNGWSQFNGAGEFIWLYSANRRSVNLNPFSQTGDQCTADDYLISPEFDLTNLVGVVLTIETDDNFSGNDLEVYYSQDYDPIINADPSSATLVSLGTIPENTPLFTSSGLNGLSGKTYLFIRFLNEDSNCATWSVEGVSITAESISSTALVFSSFTSTTREGAESIIDLQIDIINESLTTATMADVVLVSGDTNDIGNYITQSITFPLGSTGFQTVSVAITDDALNEGTERFVFELQNVSGGDSAIAGPPSSITLFLADNDQEIKTIAEIQGESQISLLEGTEVNVTGIVTAVDGDDFYIQSATPDRIPNTSEALFVSASGDVAVTVGDEVTIIGLVEEGEGAANEKTRTQISGNLLITVNSSGNNVPDATLIGRGGRIAPTQFIDSDPDTFDPTVDGADFWESMENMLVTIQNPMSVTTVGFFDVFVVADEGMDATNISPRKTITLSQNDFNPEKIEIALGSGDLLGENTSVRPTGAVEGIAPGAKFSDITGIITYDVGQYQLTPTEDFTLIEEPTLPAVATTLAGDEDKLLIATYNVLNLDPNVETNVNDSDDDIGNGRFATIAQHIINNLNSPDIIGLQEIQDNNGGEPSSAADSISADITLQILVDSIAGAGGPTYGYLDNTFLLGQRTSGGQPNGNIRTAFLYNTARVDTVTIPNDTVAVRTISSQEDGDAFEGGRLPLVAAFSFNDTIVTMVNNHFSSKGGSAPIYGQLQPFVGRQEDVAVNGSLDERRLQSGAVQEYVRGYLSDTEGAPIVVLGDFNEFNFVSPVKDLEERAGLNNLTLKIPEDERYTFIFQGNSQSLDHILVSDNLLINSDVQIVHLNSEFGDSDELGSDHDPIVATINLTNFILLPEGGQEELAFSIQSSTDDAEEVTTLDGGAVGVVDGFDIGFVDLESSDIELVDDGFNGSNQIIGLRFANIDIPRGAIILEAFLRFTCDTDAPGSGADTVRTYIQIEDAINPGTFTDDLFSISSREVLKDTVIWDIYEITQEQANAREQINSSPVTSLVQKITDKPDWAEGNALSFRITGDRGERDFSSFDDDMGAAELVVNILPANGLVTSVIASTDDAEEITTPDGARDSAEVGFVDLGSSDLEVVDDGFNGSNQVVGVRFATLNVPQGARINNAYLELTSDTDGSGSGADTVRAYIKVQDDVNSATFSDELFNISSRQVFEDSIVWDISEIDSVQVADRAAINSPDVSGLVQMLVHKEGWVEGSPITFIITGEGGERDFSSADDDGPEVAPRLIVDFIETGELESVAQGNDDAEEVTTLDGGAVGVVDGFEIGFVDVGSSDIEVVDDGFNGSNQIIGLRFGNIDIERLTPIESAFIEFTLDTDGRGDNTIVDAYIQIEDTVNAAKFENELFNISSRSILDDTVFWAIDTVTEEQVSERARVASADVSSLIQQIVNREDWETGNALGFRITGDGGERDFSSANDDGPEVAPRLVIHFAQSEGNLPPAAIADIPDIKTTVGGTFSMDLNTFFEDEDTPLTFFATDRLGNELPESITINEGGILRGSLDEAAFISAEVFAESLGDTVSSTFNIIASPLSKGVLKQISSIQLGKVEGGAAGISAFDPSTDLLFVTNAEINAVEVLDYSDPMNPMRLDTIGVAGEVKSVAVGAGKVAIAMANNNEQLNGTVNVYETAGFIGSGTPIGTTYTVGALPNMVTFANDTTIVVANEGAPNNDYTVDPEGSVSIINLTNVDIVAAVATADFTAFNGQEEVLREEGVRIFGPGATVAQDLEPEFITVLGGKAYVTLQENNALAVVDLATDAVEEIVGLGFKDHGLPGNGLDPNSDNDTPILIDNRLPILGMYQPDAIASVEVNNVIYLLTANEGDARDYVGFSEATEIGKIDLDPHSFADVELIETLANGLTVSAVDADTTDSGEYKEIYAYGSRSFTIWDEAGQKVFDSEDDFEQITASLFPENFNASNTNNTFKNRSNSQGPEPEAITVGQVGETLFAFIGLERIGGIMVYDITEPTQPVFVEYINNRDFSLEVVEEGHGDLGPEGLVFVPASESPNNVALLIVSNEVSSTVTTYQVGETLPAPNVFTLELLHVTDQEAAGPAIQDAPRLSAVINALEAQDLGDDNLPDNTIKLSSGDAFLPGLFRDASVDIFGTGGVADIQIQNELGFQAIALGNHEFDFGTGELAKLISGKENGEAIASFDSAAFDDTDLAGLEFTGTNFPYLSTNLHFGPDANLGPLEIEGGLSPLEGRVTSSTIIDVNGENIAVIGATTPILASISSTGDVGILPSTFATNPSDEELDSLALVIQQEVDELLEDNLNINKVILLAHMQQIEIEFGLAERLKEVDIIVAGGSSTRLFDNNDRPRSGDSNQGMYPTFFEDANGDSVAVVNTDAQYKYVGRLVIDFDNDGKIIPSSYDALVSGAYATDSVGVADLDAENLVDPEIQALASLIESTIIGKESDIFGVASVFLNGNRSGTGTGTDPDGVRTQETNLGNLTSDANLVTAKATDSTVVISIKNGGGIRASIGQTIVQTGSSEAVRLPNEELVDSEGNIVKPEGGISQNDIATSLAFNDGLTLLTLTKTELKEVLEHGISQSPLVDGRFLQIAGVKFSFNDTLTVGERIQNAVIVDDAGETMQQIISNGELVGSPNQPFRVVTLGFIAGGGDGYPFPTGDAANRLDLYDLDGNGDDQATTGGATFAFDGTEQDALAEYLLDNFTEASPFNEEDTGPSTDDRIQNLAFRADGIGAAMNARTVANQIPDQVVDKGASVTIDVATTFSDANADAPILTTSSSDESIATASVSGTLLTVKGIVEGTSTISVTASESDDGGTVSESFKVTVNPVQSIINDLAGLSIHPVPATSSITIMHRMLNITEANIFNISGRLIKSTNLVDHSLDLSGLNAGTYILELIDADVEKSLRTKVIKR
ncbi:MAG: choice-of-anchor I family protein [Bacteroidota bacterium]